MTSSKSQQPTESNDVHRQYEREVNQAIEKENIWYGSMINAWLTTKLELDKHLLSLSSFAIGLLVTLATTVGFKSCYSQVFGLLSGVAFFATTFCVLEIFQANGRLIKSEVTGQIDAVKESNEKLKGLDLKASLFFRLGVAFLLITAIAVVLGNQQLEKTMSQNDPNKHVTDQSVEIKKSWENVNEMKPAKPEPPPEKSDESKRKE